jgi:hypothetical protein
MTAETKPSAPAQACFNAVMAIGAIAHRFVWRARAVAILRRAPFRWPLRTAWQYAGGLYHLFLEEEFEPAEAIDCDRQYWEE